MRRTALLGITTTILLALATGSIAAALFMPAGPTAALPAAGSADTVRRFYAVANEVIASGDPAPLQAVVAPHFVDAEPLPGVGTGRTGLEAYLVALHAAHPGMRLEVTELVAADDRVAARVGVRNGPDAATLGGSVVEQSAPWGAAESFRVAGGRVVERRSSVDAVAVVRSLAEASVSFSAPARRVVTLKRFTFAPGARWDSLPAGPHLLVLEAGALHLDQRHGQGGNANSHSRTLSAGGSFVAAAGLRYSATNPGAGAATLLVVAFAGPPASSQWVAPEEAALSGLSGVSAQTLAGGLAAEVGVGSATVTLGRATLARDARLTLTSAAGPVLLVVDAGQADVAAWGMAWVRRGGDGISSVRSEATLVAGDGLLLPPDGLAMLHGAGAGAVEALILTVRPADEAHPGSPTT